MPQHPAPPPRTPGWSTSSLGHPADITADDYAALSEQLNLCTALRSTWEASRATADSLQSLLAGRVVTVAMVMTLLASAASSVR